ncbi:MAG TPA: Ku protein, partial [Ramlibacter sp.]|nr:Ku protein [Ramlibacter sp.]
KLVEAKAKAGETAEVHSVEKQPAGGGADVIDLTELLKRSLQGGGRAGKSAAPAPAPAAKSRPRTAAKAAKTGGTAAKKSTGARPRTRKVA